MNSVKALFFNHRFQNIAEKRLCYEKHIREEQIQSFIAVRTTKRRGNEGDNCGNAFICNCYV